ncbi:MAG TPA: hypothetical protein VK797_05805 [Tepidisphaeraceae bacterium]|jgi:hypothetical protein|nr:hypothetical protein [Tepidisphaeraceae bacterium]
MLKIAKPERSKTLEPTKKIYVTPRLVTHGDVARLTNHDHKPHHHGDGPESELS